MAGIEQKTAIFKTINGTHKPGIIIFPCRKKW
nr:MAG TPA: hypothetical protein [Caudoviricetes sp.]